MKKLLLLLFISVIMNRDSIAQSTSAGVPAPPPSRGAYNGYQPSFIRGLYVDCANDIIIDMFNGSPIGLEADLKNFVATNYISYLALYAIDNNSVIGNPALQPFLRQFLSDMRGWFPNIQIGPIISDQSFFTLTDPFFLNDPKGSACFENPQGRTMHEWNDLMNPISQDDNALRQSELLKSVARAAEFSGDDELNHPNSQISEKCINGFDFIYVEVEYWVSGNLSDYNIFKNCLALGQRFKCKYNCLHNIDAEFSPQNIIAIGSQQFQINECDFLIDRATIPAYTPAMYAKFAFDYPCATYINMADGASKPRSKIFYQASAESSTYSYCSNSNIPPQFLGDYLDGTNTLYNGNMYSVEKEYVSRLDNPTYVCPNCGCLTYNYNHYDGFNPKENDIVGSIWFTYTMMQSHGLTKHSRPNKNEPFSTQLNVYPNPSQNFITLSLNHGLINTIKLNNGISEKTIQLSNPKESYQLNISQLSEGVYNATLESTEGLFYSKSFIKIK